MKGVLFLDKHLKEFNFEEKINTTFTEENKQGVLGKINEIEKKRTKKQYYFQNGLTLAFSVGLIIFGFTFISNNIEGTKENAGVEKDVLTGEQTVEVDPISNSDKNIVDSAIPLKLTPEQKEEYHKRYVEIVEEVNQKKLGIGLEVPPIEEFQLEHWKEPKAYEKMIQTQVEGFLASERKELATVSNDLKPAVTNPYGETTKATYLYFPDTLKKIEVTAIFDTPYNADKNSRIFSNVDAISTKILSNHGTWEQTIQKATLLDGGQTYRIYIEGIYDVNNTTFEKAFTIEFHCDEYGKIY